MNDDPHFYPVPCNGCTRCCKGDAIRILRHEDASQWHTEPHPWVKDALMLAHKPNGDCLYLGPEGCTIQAHKPQQCREMDCRRLAKNITYTQARKLAKKNQLHFGVWKKGRELLRQKQ